MYRGQKTKFSFEKKNYPRSNLALIISLPISASDLNVDDLNLEMEGYGQIKAYAKSKLANILFTKELDRRYKGLNNLCICLFCS